MSEAGAGPLAECVPNFAEGRDRQTILAILNGMRLPEVLLLDYWLDPLRNRSVITVAGPPSAVCEAAVRAAGVAAERIDLTKHSSARNTGFHPRIGAADVIPFVPVRDCSLLECALLAREAASALWDRYNIPSFLYEAAATRPDRVRLSEVRRGQFEGLREEGLRDSSRRPDVGGPGLHPTAGASAIGARHPLVEYVATLQTRELRIARAIARELRDDSGESIRAEGLHGEAGARVGLQVIASRPGSLESAFIALQGAAGKHGTAITSGELLGLAPRHVCEAGNRWLGSLTTFVPLASVLEERLLHPLVWPSSL